MEHLTKIGILALGGVGGSTKVALREAEFLASKKKKVFFFSLLPFYKKNTKNLKFFFKENVYLPLYPLKFPSWHLCEILFEVFKRENIKLLHVHYAIPNLLPALLIKKLLNIKIILSLHGTDALGFSQPKELLQEMMRDVDALVVPSFALKDKLKENFKINQDSISVIWNFVNTNKFKPPANREEIKKKFIDKDALMIVTTTNYRWVKRLPYILSILKKILQKHPKTKLFIIGDGIERDNIQVVAKELGIFNNIEFLGYQQKIKEYLQAGDIYIQTSFYESFSISALEAAACGCVVFSNKEGGIEEVLENCAFFCDTPDEFAEKILWIWEDKIKRKEISQRASQRAQQFKEEKILPLYLKLIDEVFQRDMG